ncbi:MAG: mannose-1-phosphate guanylyltransferase [Candidatus Xenobia bacterium]
MHDLVCIIMAGGAGTRFWPVSTERKPKQFLPLGSERTLLQASCDRLEGLCPPDRTLVLTSRAYSGLVREQVQVGHVVGEPCRRDTAAAVALAALLCRKLYGNATMAILTSDHHIEPVDRFQACLASAARGARDSGRLYTFAIPPTRPETGYGYLELGPRLERPDALHHHELLSFREKPDRITARHFLQEGRYYWNSGMFCWTTSAILAELEVHLPGHLEALAPAVQAYGTDRFEQALETSFQPLSPISIDYAVMEKATRRAAVVTDYEWSDLGGWQAVEDFLPEQQGNRHRGRLASLASKGNVIYCEEPEELVSLVGVENLVVVRAGNRTLVAHRDHLEEVKKLVGSLSAEER